MAKMSYREQLLHPSWQRRRLEILKRSDFSCEICGDEGSTLHVHHRRYVKGRMVWEYADEELTALCETCHKDQHVYRELLDKILFEADACQGAAYQQAIGLLGGYFAALVSIGPETEQEAIDCDGHSHDLGILAGLAAGSQWDQLARAADIVRGKSLSPAEEETISRWKGQ